LRRDPYERLSAAEAAQHAWLRMEGSMGSTKMTGWQKAGPDPNSELPIDSGVIRDMWKFAQNNAITRAALGMLASTSASASFSGIEEDVISLEKRFKLHDVKNTGKMDVEEFIKVLKEMLQISSSEAKTLIERISGSLPATVESGEQGEHRKRRREVNYTDFITLMKTRRMANNTAAIREAFRAFEEQGDGYISHEDIRHRLGQDFKGDNERVERILGELDVNGEGLIDYVDFEHVCTEVMASKAPGPEANSEQGAESSSTLAVSGNDGGSPIAAVATGAGFVAPKVQSREFDGKSGIGSKTMLCDMEGDAEFQLQVEPVDATGEMRGSASGQVAGQGTSLPVSSQPAVEEQAEEEEEEEYKEDDTWAAQSDEEQLVNVKEPSSVEKAHQHQNCREEEEEEEKQEEKTSKDSRFQSFSLSLAGSSEYDDISGVNRVVSMPSDVYTVKQLPGFHSRVLRPFYASKPVSNVCMGLIRGTSLFAKQSVAAKLATIVHTSCGWFFIMPNPKYHTKVNDRKGLLSKDAGKFRFVAWWIHPRFVPQLRQWFEKMTYDTNEQDRGEQRREAARKGRSGDAREAPRETRGDKQRGESGTIGVSNDQPMPVQGSSTLARASTDPGCNKTDENGNGRSSGGMPSPRFGDASAVGDERRPSSESVTRVSVEGVSRGSGSDSCGAQGMEECSDALSTTPERANGGAGLAGSGQRCTVLPAKRGETDGSACRAARGSDGESGNRTGAPSGGARGDHRDGNRHKDPNLMSDPVAYGMGSPGDFQFSDVPKPENYLHTYRDLHSREHVSMLSQLYEGMNRFLRSLFDESFLATATISTGFHYPVRTQYSTLHMQVRVNSGSVCRDDGRGIDMHTLIDNLKRDRLAYERDEETLRYRVTENVKVSLLAAANEFAELNPGQEACRQVAPLSFDLGLGAMPTIHDEGEDEDGGHTEDERGHAKQKPPEETVLRSPSPAQDASWSHQYIVNLQPLMNSRFHKVLLAKRAKCRENFGADPTYLYPLHISVTGFFEATREQVEGVVENMRDELAKELGRGPGTRPVVVGEVVSTPTGYVLLDVQSPCVTSFARRLQARAAQDHDVQIRPKRVNHVSLAADRPSDEARQKIVDIYVPSSSSHDDGALCGLEEGETLRQVYEEASFDLVLSRLLQRSSFERFTEDGRGHSFVEVVRIPVLVAPSTVEVASEVDSPVPGPVASPDEHDRLSTAADVLELAAAVLTTTQPPLLAVDVLDSPTSPSLESQPP